MSQDESGDLVQVAVPRQHLMAVYGLLANLATASAPEAVGNNKPANDELDSDGVWPVEDLRRFAATPTATSATIVKVLDVLAKRPGTYMSTSELERDTGVHRANLKGAFSALTRHIKKHYEDRRWMLTFEWGPALGTEYPAEGHYMLTEDQASRWQEARKG